MASTLEEMTRRITALADEADRAQDNELSTELFGIERALAGALRRLERCVDARRP